LHLQQEPLLPVEKPLHHRPLELLLQVEKHHQNRPLEPLLPVEKPLHHRPLELLLQVENHQNRLLEPLPPLARHQRRPLHQLRLRRRLLMRLLNLLL
jgi:hypothetical protein